jgi:hypothetical protein
MHQKPQKLFYASLSFHSTFHSNHECTKETNGSPLSSGLSKRLLWLSKTFNQH